MTIPEGQQPPDPVSGHRDKVDFTSVRWGSVEWTNLCLLYLRACESRLPQPILGDDYAARDVARIDYDFARIHRVVHPAINQYMVALRSVQFDAFITEYLKDHQPAAVLHLGCGLHSRAFRIAAPEGVQWFDVDLPNVIALRRQLYSESDTYRMVGSSVTDPGWINELPAGGPVLIVAEGILMSLTPADVTELLHRLIDRFDSGELLADFLSEWGPRLSKIFTSMSAKDAAKVFEQMDEADVITILGAVNDRKAAEILTLLPPARAASISKSLLKPKGPGK